MGVRGYKPSKNSRQPVVPVPVVVVMILTIVLVVSFGHRSSLVAHSCHCTLRAVRNRLVLAVKVGNKEGDPQQPGQRRLSPATTGTSEAIRPHACDNVVTPCFVASALSRSSAL